MASTFFNRLSLPYWDEINNKHMTTPRDCPVCMTPMNVDDIRMLHLDRGIAHVVCAACAPQLDICPFCRAQITGVGLPHALSIENTEFRINRDEAIQFVTSTELLTETAHLIWFHVAPLLIAAGMVFLLWLTTP